MKTLVTCTQAFEWHYDKAKAPVSGDADANNAITGERACHVRIKTMRSKCETRLQGAGFIISRAMIYIVHYEPPCVLVHLPDHVPCGLEATRVISTLVPREKNLCLSGGDT
jgi:hypothetical protein